MKQDIFCYKWKKWFSWAMGAAEADAKLGDEWRLIWYSWWGIYIKFKPGYQSQYLEATAEALSISSHGTSLGNI